MGMPMQPEQQQMMEEGPVSMDMIMQLRNAARGQMDMQGAAGRRLGGIPQEDPTLANGQTPEDIMLDDMEQSMAVEPPDIGPDSAKKMMMYGSVLDYLMRAKGEVVNG